MAVNSQPAQDFVPVEEVRDGVVILKDGSMRMVLMTSSLNFALKSEEEQAAILQQFQAFLNSLDYPTQILIQSRRMDIKPYLSLLRERLKHQLNDLMKIQTREYIEFVEQFTDQANVMTKSFFVVVPYTPQNLLQAQKKQFTSFLSRITGKGDGDNDKTEGEGQESRVDAAAFEEARSQLEQRTNVVKQGLARTGIRVVPLGTEEIIELYYKIFNPSDTETPIGTDES